jgi:hypothetical protein
MFTRRFVTSLVVVIATTAALAGCAGESLDDQLVALAQKANGAPLTLESVMSGEWDHYLVVCPYDPDVNGRLGFDWADAPDTSASDVSQLIVFTSRDTVVSTARFSFDKVDLCTSDVWPLEEKSAALTFAQNGSGVWIATPAG